MKKTLIAALLATSLLTACTSPVETQSSGIETPGVWSRLIGNESKPADLNAPLALDAKLQVQHDWWKHFNDPTLDALISEALTNNKTLAIAKARVEEARADRGVARSALFPQISGVADASRGDQGYFTSNKTINIGDADIEATWELDLFGKNQAHMAETGAILQSEEASQHAVTVGLLAEVARNYFDMRNFEQQIALTQQNLETQKRTLELIHAQVAGAYASDFDVQRAAAQVSTTEAQIPSLKTAYDATVDRLNVLLGHAPGTKDAALKTPQELKPLDAHILVSAPASVLATRPDVAVAERRFAASISAHTEAKALRFPDISLTGLFGLQDTTLFPGTHVWNVGAGLVQPILNFGRIESQIDAADARQKQAFLNYQQTVLEALENMENALSSYVHETGRNASLDAAVDQNRKAAELSRQQYTSGYTGLLDVLVAQRNVLDAESAQTASEFALRKDLVNIYTAAGGGWDIKAEVKH